MFNHVGVMGRLTHDPELRRTQNGTAVISFTLAVERDVKSKVTDERVTDWIDCVAWRGTAEFIARNFRKGQSALVSGRLQTRDWFDANGNKRRSVEVLADEVYFAGPRKNGDSGVAGAVSGGVSGSVAKMYGPPLAAPAPAPCPCAADAYTAYGMQLEGFEPLVSDVCTKEDLPF